MLAGDLERRLTSSQRIVWKLRAKLRNIKMITESEDE